MRVRKTGRALFLGLLGAGLALGMSPAARAQQSAKFTSLYDFTGFDDGYSPNAFLRGSDGNFYGTTAGGGAHFLGSVFKVTPAGVLTTIYSFTGATDGGVPGGGLALGHDGNLYGTTRQAGANHAGTIYKVTQAGAFTVLRALGGAAGGAAGGALVVGKDGNFYGTTNSAGTLNGGTVYRFTPAGVLSVLHNFGNVGAENNDPLGYYLNSGLALGSDGNFYGTSYGGGAHSGGTFFRITPTGTVTALYSFQPNNEVPISTLVQGGDGNFYGAVGGDQLHGNGGAVIKLTTAGVETVVHSFAGDGSTDPTDNSSLLLGNDGNLYGLTQVGGTSDEGTLYQINAAGVFTDLYDFNGSDGSGPGNAGLVQGTDGNFYGVTLSGGSGENGGGTIFKVAVHPAFFAGAAELSGGVDYLSFANGNYFGYYSYLTDPNYIYHFDLGYEYVFDANDGKAGVYFYDFKSKGYFYTSPTFPFPYLYDFSLNSVVYYYPDPKNAGHYNTNGIRYFYVVNTGKIISK